MSPSAMSPSAMSSGPNGSGPNGSGPNGRHRGLGSCLPTPDSRFPTPARYSHQYVRNASMASQRASTFSGGVGG